MASTHSADTGLRLNSPNDVVLTSGGDISADPCYGLAGREDEKSEGQKSGVYFVSSDDVSALMSGSTGADPSVSAQPISYELEYPNGVALSLDEGTLFVVDSNSAAPAVYKYAIRIPNVKRDELDDLLLDDLLAEEEVEEDDQAELVKVAATQTTRGPSRDETGDKIEQNVCKC